MPESTSHCTCALLPAASVQSMYIRVKRKKTTIFLVVEPTDTVLEVKGKLQALIDKVGRGMLCNHWMGGVASQHRPHAAEWAKCVLLANYSSW